MPQPECECPSGTANGTCHQMFPIETPCDSTCVICLTNCYEKVS